jgi:hypothetical protein
MLDSPQLIGDRSQVRQIGGVLGDLPQELKLAP